MTTITPITIQNQRQTYDGDDGDVYGGDGDVHHYLVDYFCHFDPLIYLYNFLII